MPLIIREDTVWHAGDVVKLKQDVQIAEGAKLTIEAGTTIVGGGHSIVAFGEMDAGVSGGLRTTFKNVGFEFGGLTSGVDPSYFHIENALFQDGAFLAPGGEGRGHFDVSGSTFSNTSGFHIWYPTENSSFVGNVFNGTDTISGGVGNGPILTISENAFLSTRGPAIENWAAFSGSEMIVAGNSFLSLRQTAMELPKGYDSAGIIGTGNYFGTLDPVAIQKRILDANDDLNRADIIDVSNPLSDPSINSPVFYDVRTSTAYGNGGDNRLLTSVTQDTLFGFSGNDVLSAGAGDDKLFGGTGTDTLTGGRGIDLLAGGADADTFRFSGKFGVDTISDFEAGSETQDLIDLTKIAGISDFGDIQSHLSQHRGNVWIEFGADRIVLQHTKVAELSDADFLF